MGGEAKKRGTFEQRRDQALERQEAAERERFRRLLEAERSPANGEPNKVWPKDLPPSPILIEQLIKGE